MIGATTNFHNRLVIYVEKNKIKQFSHSATSENLSDCGYETTMPWQL